MGISLNLKGLRKKEGYSQVFLARLLNVDKSTVGAWERGVQKPHSDNVFRLAKIFNISADALLGCGYRDEFGLEFNPHFRQIPNLDIERRTLSLSDIMYERGISRSAFAKALDVTTKTICNWQSKGLPALRIYQTLFWLLELDVETFYALR